MKKLITLITGMVIMATHVFSQNYQVDDIKIGLSRGTCYQAAINIDKSTIIDSDNRKSYYGDVTHQDAQAAFEIAAYPQGEQASSYNRISVVAYARNGGHQEIALTAQGNSTIFYPNQIKSYTNNYGFHFELGNQDGNLLEQLLVKELIKIDITEKTCGSTSPNQPTYQNNTPPRPTNPNEGCKELHEAISSSSNKMYKWPDEDKGKAWAESKTKKIYDLPGGCKDRDREVNKLFDIAGKLYPKFHEEDERYAWFKTMLDKSMDRPSNYTTDHIGDQIDEILTESAEFFDWHEEDKKVRWVTNKITKLLE